MDFIHYFFLWLFFLAVTFYFNRLDLTFYIILIIMIYNYPIENKNLELIEEQKIKDIDSLLLENENPHLMQYLKYFKQYYLQKEYLNSIHQDHLLDIIGVNLRVKSLIISAI